MKKLLLILTTILLLTSCSQTPNTDGNNSDSEFDRDVVIIGAGGAGLAAAISAHEAGADVIILEKMPIAGGNTTRSTGGMNAAETKFQEALGIEDSVELFVEETMAGGYNLNNRELVEYMAEHSAETIEWLDALGMPLENVSFSGGFTVARIHAPKDGSAVGSYLVDGLLKVIKEKGIKIAYNTEATELVMEDNKVVGVKATQAGQEVIYHAKSVVVAAGGFGGNLEMVVKYQPGLEGFVTTNHAGATGDGILMAEVVGADTVDMEEIQIHPTVEQETSNLITEALRGDGAILVNQEGKRFTNELLTRDVVSAAEIAQTGGYAYIIFDQTVRDNRKAVDKYVAQGLTKQGDTYEELAKELGVDEATFTETMNQYNEYVKNGKDDEFDREEKSLQLIENAPYYAVKIAPGVHHTMGGIKINVNTEVLDVDDKVITALYAAGEVTGGVHGGNRIGGNAVTDIMVFGKVAGNQAATYALANGGHGVKDQPGEDDAPVINVPTEPGIYKDGVYTETAQGNNGEFTIVVTIDNGNVSKIEFPENTETSTLFAAVEENIVKQIIETQKAEGIDAISGATVSSNAVLETVGKILDANKQ